MNKFYKILMFELELISIDRIVAKIKTQKVKKLTNIKKFQKKEFSLLSLLKN